MSSTNSPQRLQLAATAEVIRARSLAALSAIEAEPATSALEFPACRYGNPDDQEDYCESCGG